MSMKSSAEVTISVLAQKTLMLDIYKRRRIEACGLLLGNIDDLGNWHIKEVHPLRNIFDSPVYFEFAPEDVLAVELNDPGRVVGVYHSHPTGLAIASHTDRQNMKRVNVDEQIPWVWLIISGPFDQPPTVFDKVRQRLNSVAGQAILAYHHYKHKGLRRIHIAFEEPGD